MSPILEMQYVDCKRFVALRCVHGTTQPAFYNRRTRGLLRGSPPAQRNPQPQTRRFRLGLGALRYSRGDGPSGLSDYFAMSSVPLTVTLATWSTSMIWSKKKPRLIISLPPTSSLFMELLAFDTSILLPSFIVKT